MTWQTISAIIAVAVEFGALIGVIQKVNQIRRNNDEKLERIAEGNKCQLRSEMTRTYYHHKETGKLRQYEYENFVTLYEAYKALGGNSFIDKIYEEVKKWEIET